MLNPQNGDRIVAIDSVTSLHPVCTLVCCTFHSAKFAFSALTLLVGRQEGHLACKKRSGGVLVWLSVWSEVLTCMWPSWCHCHSLSLASVKSRSVLPFWYRLAWVDPDQGPLNGMCVCAVVRCSHRRRRHGWRRLCKSDRSHSRSFRARRLGSRSRESVSSAALRRYCCPFRHRLFVKQRVGH